MVSYHNAMRLIAANLQGVTTNPMQSQNLRDLLHHPTARQSEVNCFDHDKACPNLGVEGVNFIFILTETVTDLEIRWVW